VEARNATEENTIYESIKIVAQILAKAIVKATSEMEQARPRRDDGWIRPPAGNYGAQGEHGRLTLSVSETAKLLGLSRNAAYEAVHSGQIPSIRFGDRIYVPRAALMKLLEQADSPGKP